MLKPLQDKIVVLMDESLPNVAGIHLAPDVSKWREATDQIGNRGTVVAIGPGKRDQKTGQLYPMVTQVGDIVRFSELQYYEHKEDGKRYAVISEMDVTGIEEVGTMPTPTLTAIPLSEVYGCADVEELALEPKAPFLCDEVRAA